VLQQNLVDQLLSLSGYPVRRINVANANAVAAKEGQPPR
jgi:hypothetical protein